MPAVRMMYLRKVLCLEELQYRHLRLSDASGPRHPKRSVPFLGCFCNSCLFLSFYISTLSQDSPQQYPFSNVLQQYCLVVNSCHISLIGFKMESDEYVFNNISHSGAFYKCGQFSLL